MHNCSKAILPTRAPLRESGVAVSVTRGQNRARSRPNRISTASDFAHPTERPQMKIQQIITRLVRLPLEEPLVNAPPMPGMMREFVTVQIRTDDGIEGIGVTAFGGKLIRTIKLAVEELGELIKGDDPINVDAIRQKLRLASANCGPGGVVTLALTAIDIALWDIRGKALNLPLARLLGGLRERVPAYASGALTRISPADKVVEAAA